MPVHAGRGQREIEQIIGEGSARLSAGAAKAAVVGFRFGHNMSDVGFAGAAESGAGVGAVNPPAHSGYNLRLYRLRVGVIVRVVGRAAILRRDDKGIQSVHRLADAVVR